MANNTNNPADFQRFIQRTESAKSNDIGHGLRMADDTELEKMRNHILKTYEGVDVPHFYTDVAGQVWDCIPIEQQPALKKSNSKVLTAPDLPGAASGDGGPKSKNHVQQIGGRGILDRFGNEMTCPPGTIPIRRVTLEDMSRFRTFADFFQKAPGGGRHPYIKGAREVEVTHKYAHAYQNVDNVGGRSNVNVWQPGINTGASQVFSLSQHWYAGGSGTTLQTVECGWQVFPGLYGNANANLFVYWTADGYGSTGCYNLSCPAFVQTNPKWNLGGYLQPVSTSGGTQYEMFFAYYLNNGGWWLYLQGGAASDAVGYYPLSLFNNGQLASKATSIDYGGETVGATSWPPMGSGAFAKSGEARAAYQRNIYYFPPGSSTYKDSDLSGSQPSPGCYTIDVSSKGDWDEHFYFGGPGGTGC